VAHGYEIFVDDIYSCLRQLVSQSIEHRRIEREPVVVSENISLPRT